MARARRNKAGGAAVVIVFAVVASMTSPAGGMPSPSSATYATATDPTAGFAFLPPLGDRDGDAPGAVAEWLLPFLSVELCAWNGSSCGVVVATATAQGQKGDRLRLDKPGHRDASFRATLGTAGARFDAGLYRLRVLVGTTELGHHDVLVSKKAKPSDDPKVIRPGEALPVRFRVRADPYWSSLPRLSVTPHRAPAGSVVVMTSSSPIAADGLELFVDGEPAVVHPSAGGGFTAGVPYFLENGWPHPPHGPVDILLLRNGAPAAVGPDALTVLPLAQAPGSTLKGIAAFDDLAHALDRVGSHLAESGDPDQEKWLASLTEAVNDLVHGTDPRSLANFLAAADAKGVRLLDASLAASGVLDGLRRYADLLGMVADGFEQSHALGMQRLAVMGHRRVASAADVVSDVDLASDMQFYELAKLFGETVVGPTAETWGTFMGTLFSAVALGPVGGPILDAAQWIGVVLTVLDFALNKIYLALLPAKVSDFSLSVTSPNLVPGQVTSAQLRLTARNEPVPIGLQDFIGQLLNELGAPGNGAPKDVLTDAVNFFLGFLQARLASRGNVELWSIPPLTWTTTITDTRLVERKTQTPAVIAGLADQVNWKASSTTTNSQQGRIFARTTFGPEALLVALPPGISYTPGAFGVDNLRDSNIVTVNVGTGVTIAPRPTSVNLNSQTQFTATVVGQADTAVTWSATGGTITSTGVFTAPSTVPNPPIGSVTATSVADPTASDTVNFNIGAVSVSITPDSATLPPGGSTVFSASVTGLNNQAVTWSASCGSIDQNGVYRAPAVPGTCNVIATSVANASASDTASVTVGLNNLGTVTIRGGPDPSGSARSYLSVYAGSGITGLGSSSAKLTYAAGCNGCSLQAQQCTDPSARFTLQSDVVVSGSGAVGTEHCSFAIPIGEGDFRRFDAEASLSYARPNASTAVLTVAHLGSTDEESGTFADGAAVLSIDVQMPTPGSFYVYQNATALTPAWPFTGLPLFPRVVYECRTLGAYCPAAQISSTAGFVWTFTTDAAGKASFVIDGGPVKGNSGDVTFTIQRCSDWTHDNLTPSCVRP
jgi:hypothetical protein